MGQSSHATRAGQHDALDLVITNALIIDYQGIVKGDIGIKDGRIVKVGKAGNPDTMEGVDQDLIVGASTEVIAGENLLVTAGGIDTHIHFICPQQVYEAISNGVTTMIGGGTGRLPARTPRPVRQERGTSHECSRLANTGLLTLASWARATPPHKSRW